MDNLMKTTIEVELSKAKFLTKIMEKINFKEVSTFPTGGLHSHPTLLITFQGDKKDYHERGYVRIPIQSNCSDLIPSNYYSIKFPNGIYASTLDDFKQKMSYDEFDNGTYAEL